MMTDEFKYSLKLSTHSKNVALPLDSFFALLGGASSALVMKKLQEAQTDFEETSNQILAFNQRRKMTIYSLNDGSGKFPLEILYIKITTIIALLKELRSYHMSKQGPHMGISPDRVVVSIPLSKKSSPPFWNISLKLLAPVLIFPDEPELEVLKKQLGRPKGPLDKFFSFPASLLPLDNTVSADVSLRIFRKSGPSWDLYSLGKILFFALLINDWNTIDELDEQLLKLVSGIEKVKSKTPLDLEGLRKSLLEGMSRSKGIFSSSNVIYQNMDSPNGEKSIPDEIWDEILIVAFDMLSSGDQTLSSLDQKADQQNPEASVLEPFIEKLETLSCLLNIELFHGEVQNKDISDAISQFFTAS